MSKIDVCDNCCIAEEGIEVSHGCRSKETSCIDGQDCPDYIAECDCKECKILGGDSEDYELIPSKPEKENVKREAL